MQGVAAERSERSEIGGTDGRADLRERIAVQPPYEALGALDCPVPGIVFAEVPREQPLGREAGPMTAGEMGRHLAVVGSLAAASLGRRAGRHYYLAHRARFTRTPGATGCGRTLRARASASEPPGRRALVESALADAEGRPVARADIEYLVVPPRVFARLFADRRAALGPVPLRAHARPLPVTILRAGRDGLEGEVAVDEQACAGHFDGFPALPVAHLLHALAGGAGALLAEQRRRPSLGFRVERGEVEARRLSFPGDRIRLSVRPGAVRDGAHHFTCAAASAKGERLVTLALTLRAAVS